MKNDPETDSSTDEKIEQELKAVADAERHPETAMAEGKRDGASSEPSDPLNPKSHETGQNYLGHETIFTGTDPLDKRKP